MPTSIRETALAALAARLVAQIPTAAVERARRAPVDVDTESLPRLVLTSADWSANEEAEPGATHYTLGFAVTGYATARTDLAAEQALHTLHAAVVAAITAWQPDTDGLAYPAEEGAEFRLYDAEESAKPTGEFIARFSLLCIAPTGNPYTA